ncbi:threonine/homoserine/homoserine lactone efflux protein [Anaerospora hongkongensis]|uniref:Threonine/homoserine/homoserine lactone efflux protein n=1 Tax=Anaerospora hongkongensis TaxID=244830 RepID=A0A4R1Q0N8_9FIRM|nr:LysE family transporter [Anaerospora hongkongensis]TCL36883.1 threonine/homoserine/homoserine lactone efflux protein [Anaerospora hongkongensis]
MDYNLLLTCIFSGFFLAAPIGPVNLICIRRTLTDGYIAGLTVGLGAAVADTVYGYAAAAGLSFITDFILQYHTAFRWGGGLFIIYLGFRTLHAVVQENSADKTAATGLYKLFAGIFLLTLTNPITLFTFIALFSSLGVAVLVTNAVSAALAAFGVFCGSALWWVTLTCIVQLLRKKVTARALTRINKLAGTIIILLGIASIIKL